MAPGSKLTKAGFKPIGKTTHELANGQPVEYEFALAVISFMGEPFGPPPKEYNYRCSVCGTELLVNEAIIDAGIGMAKFNKEYYEGDMPKVGCPGCNNYTMECVE